MPRIPYLHRLRCILLLLALTLMCTPHRLALPAPPDPNNLRVLFAEWQSDDGESESFDADQVTGVDANFWLAVKHFNDRDTTAFPPLASIASCTKTMTIVGICDTSGNGVRATRFLHEFDGEYDAVVGFASNAILHAAAVAAGPFGDGELKPVVSHWASTPKLHDPNQDFYPNGARTFLADDAYVLRLASLIAALGFEAGSCVYVNQDIVPDQQRLFEQAMLSRYGVDVTCFPFEYDDQESIDGAFHKVRQTNRNLVVIFSWTTDVETYFASAVKKASLNTTNNVFVFANVDYVIDLDSILADPDLEDLMTGALYVLPEIKSPARFEQYLDEFSSHGQSQVNELNTNFFPPRGFGNETAGSCKNDQLDLQVANSFFQDATPDPLTWSSAYDAVMALGLALCSTNDPLSGVALFEAIKAASFAGIGGPVSFLENGDRDPDTLDFVALNWHVNPETSALQMTKGIQFVDGKWDVNGSSANFKLRSGTSDLPTTYAPPVVDLHYLPPALRYLGYAETVICALASLSCIVWVLARRNRSRIVRAAQPFFMMTFALGLFVSSFSIMALTVDDSPSDPIGNPDLWCRVIPIYFAGFALAIGSLVVKAWRVYAVFTNTSLNRADVRLSRAALVLFVYVACVTAALVAWSAVAPLRYVRAPREYDIYGQVTSSQAACTVVPANVGAAWGLFAVIFTLDVLGLGVLQWFASRSRTFADDYQDSRAQSLLSTAVAQACFIVLPTLFASADSIEGRFSVLSSFATFTILAMLGFMFFPKVYLDIFGDKNRIRNGAPRTHASTAAIVVNVNGDASSRSTAASVASASAHREISVMDAMRIPVVRKRFEAYAKRLYVIESYQFIVDILDFKAAEAKMGDEAKASMVRSIAAVYLEPGSLLEVNISDDCRRQTLVKVAGPSVHGGVFDDALKQVSDMLQHGAWRVFTNEGGMWNTGAPSSTAAGGKNSGNDVGPSASPRVTAEAVA